MNKGIKIVDPKRWTDFICREMNYYLPKECHGGVVVDCGCNVGAFELQHRNRFEKYYCFDICEENLKILKDNLKKIDQINYEAEKRACWKESGVLKPAMAHSNEFNKTEYFGNSGACSIIEGVNENSDWGWKLSNSFDNVETISLDEIIDKFGNIKVLKVDIEGSEYDFLFGKDFTKIEYIVGEFHHSRSEKWKKLINFIGETHKIVHTDGVHVFTFERRK